MMAWNELDETEMAPHKTIESVSQRDEKISLLMVKSDIWSLSTQSKSPYFVGKAEQSPCSSAIIFCSLPRCLFLPVNKCFGFFAAV